MLQLDMSAQQEKKSPKNRQKGQRPTCSHCQESHKYGNQQLEDISIGPGRPCACSSVSGSSCVPCQVDSQILLSQCPASLLALTVFPAPLPQNSLCTQGRDLMRTSYVVSLVQCLTVCLFPEFLHIFPSPGLLSEEIFLMMTGQGTGL